MKSLLSRLERLEQVSGTSTRVRGILMRIVDCKDGKPFVLKLIGVRSMDDYQRLIERPAGEPEEEFIARIFAEKKRGAAHVVQLIEERA